MFRLSIIMGGGILIDSKTVIGNYFLLAPSLSNCIYAFTDA